MNMDAAPGQGTGARQETQADRLERVYSKLEAAKANLRESSLYNDPAVKKALEAMTDAGILLGGMSVGK